MTTPTDSDPPRLYRKQGGNKKRSSSQGASTPDEMEITESFEGVKEVHAEVVEKDQKNYEEGAALSLPAFDLTPQKGTCFFYGFSSRGTIF